VEICSRYQIEGKVNQGGDGTAHHSIGGGDSVDDYVNMHLFHEYLSYFYQEKPYILHACNPVGGFPNAETYVHRIHKDAATFIAGFHLRINMLVMLDDFTVKNGATLVLRGSHLKPERPPDFEFDQRCESLVGTAGSVVLFNSYLWHRGGRNTTQNNRVALTLSYGPAFIKPQMDYARLLGEERGVTLSPLSREILGYNSRVPVNHREWYRPKGERLYHADQG
jgi:ectoine hydroxylase-related dioxygenase (phytanoyl-CoA dioxygenase family)